MRPAEQLELAPRAHCHITHRAARCHEAGTAVVDDNIVRAERPGHDQTEIVESGASAVLTAQDRNAVPDRDIAGCKRIPLDRRAIPDRDGSVRADVTDDRLDTDGDGSPGSNVRTDGAPAIQHDVSAIVYP